MFNFTNHHRHLPLTPFAFGLMAFLVLPFSPFTSRAWAETGLKSSTQNVGTAPAEIQFFKETGHNVTGPFLQNFLQTGGLAANGLPLTEEFKETGGLSSQVFERAILTLHQPLEGNGEAQPKAYIDHKLLGSILTAGRSFKPVPDPGSSETRYFFPETAHSLNFGFLAYWKSNGGLPAFGFAISEEFQEASPEDGKFYTVQYFERSRFEYHPEFEGSPYAVQAGLLGKQYGLSHYDPDLFKKADPLLLGSQQLIAVPSLMYHHIRDLTAPLNSELNNYSVTPWAFVEQLDWLKANGYNTVTISQITQYLKYGVPLPAKPVNLRFDDGWQNQLFAAQEMKKRGMTATFFIITQAVSYPYMTPQQVKQLDLDGFEVASHTRNHPFLTRNGPDFDWAQISGSKADLEKLLGHPVTSFAYPFGDHNAYVDSLVQKAGYDSGAGIEWSGFWRSSRLYNEPAISVSNIRTLGGFISRLNLNY